MGQVAISCRVSRGDQSCERQERDLKAFARRAGYKVSPLSRRRHRAPMHKEGPSYRLIGRNVAVMEIVRREYCQLRIT